MPCCSLVRQTVSASRAAVSRRDLRPPCASPLLVATAFDGNGQAERPQRLEHHLGGRDTILVDPDYLVRVSALPEWNTMAGSPGWWSYSAIEYIVLAAVVPRLWTPVIEPWLIALR